MAKFAPEDQAVAEEIVEGVASACRRYLSAYDEFGNNREVLTEHLEDLEWTLSNWNDWLGEWADKQPGGPEEALVGLVSWAGYES